MDDIEDIERRLDKLEAKALLHGRTEAIEREIQELCGKLDLIEMGEGEDWLRQRDQDLGRALQPYKP